MLRKISVICTGNICRSPIAERLLKEGLGSGDFHVFSAGTGALVGHPADASAVEIMADHGYDIKSHVAQQATPELLVRSDLILAMEQGHIDWVVRRSQHLVGRVFKLGKWNGNRDIDDPYRLPKAAFLKAYDEIAEDVAAWLAKIKQLN